MSSKSAGYFIERLDRGLVVKVDGKRVAYEKPEGFIKDIMEAVEQHLSKSFIKSQVSSLAFSFELLENPPQSVDNH